MTEIDDERLPLGNVTVRIACSTLNYKDALAITGRAPVVRNFPMVPGIDFSGVVEESLDPAHKAGDKVVLNGWGVGEHHWGGLAERARVQGAWLIPLQAPFTMTQAMAIGTAGYTAMLCVMALEDHGATPDKGEILVSGATGGVGSIAVAILSKLGYDVAAMTGRPDQEIYLKALGAKKVISRTEFLQPGKPLGKEQWVGAIDVAGGQILANICSTTKYNGTVVACGLAGGMQFPATVAPFILRGVTLVGIDSVMCPRNKREDAWRRLAQDLDLEKLSGLAQQIAFSNVITEAECLMEGKIRGRTIVPISLDIT
jgi:acrylyl-CoA reductase (NADPH)